MANKLGSLSHHLNLTLEAVRNQMYSLQCEIRDGKITAEAAQNEIWLMSNRLANLSKEKECDRCGSLLIGNESRGTTCNACLEAGIATKQAEAARDTQPKAEAGITHCILTVEKWQVRPEAMWVAHSEVTVPCRITAKRIKIVGGTYNGKIFNRQTGRQITRHYSQWFKYSIREAK